MTAGFRQVFPKMFWIRPSCSSAGPGLESKGKRWHAEQKELHLGKATQDFQTRMIEKKAGNFETLRIFSSLQIPGQGIPHPPAADEIPLIGLFDHECDLNDGNDDGFGTALVPDDEPSGAVARSSIEGEPESGSPAGIFSPGDERNESVSPSAPKLDETSILSHDAKLSNPNKFSAQASRTFRWLRPNYEPIDRFHRNSGKFASTQGVLWNLSTSPVPARNGLASNNRPSTSTKLQKNSISRHPSRVRICQ